MHTKALLGVLMVVSACGGAKVQNVAHAPGGTAGVEASSASYVSPEGAPVPAPARAESVAPAEERAGLGTAWGETRYSPVRNVSFQRADGDRPFATLTIHYDDREGASRLVDYRGERGRGARPLRLAGGAVSVSIRGEGGEPYEFVSSRDRAVVIGEEGERYVIALENHTSRQFEVVATVDGLDVINGRPGSYRNRGYLLAPYGTVAIDGFRRSQDEIAAFRFSSVTDSYAAAGGDARDVGVIGLALFAERGADSFDDEVRLRDTARPFPREGGTYARPPRW